MSESEAPKVISDVLGIKPVGEAVLVVTKGAVDGAAAFLSRLILPATEEVGLLFRDKVASYRGHNLVAVTEKARALLVDRGNPDVQVHPRLGIAIIEESSWTADDVLQGMWAGLLVSSATPEGADDSNLMFTDLLSRLTGGQARLLEHACRASTKQRSHAGLILPGRIAPVPVEDLKRISGIDDLHRLDRELDHLRALELLVEQGGFPGLQHPPDVELHGELTPSALALQMYARCKGATDLLAFYDLVDAPPV